MHIDVKFSEAANSFSVGFSGDGSFRADFGQLTTVALSELNAGNGIKIQDGTISVDTTDAVEQDNTKPVTSAAVYTVCGNIEALLKIL